MNRAGAFLVGRFSTSMQMKWHTKSDIEEKDRFNGRIIWAWLDKTLVERGAQHFIRYNTIAALTYDIMERDIRSLILDQESFECDRRMQIRREPEGRHAFKAGR